MDWVAITKATRAAFGQSVNDWIIALYVQGGWVRGPNAELTPGSLKSSVDLEQRLLQALTAGRVPAAIAQALAKELGGAWRAWADGFRLSLPGVYPKLAAVPGPWRLPRLPQARIRLLAAHQPASTGSAPRCFRRTSYPPFSCTRGAMPASTTRSRS